MSITTAAPRDTPAAPSLEAGIEAAREAGLRYVRDTNAGIRRRRRGRSFSYTGAQGQPVTDEPTLARVRSLAIPPAWTDVWICADPRGHIQATGRDAKGRKQYRYHPRWRETRDATKYDRMIAFGEALPRIRKATEKDLALPGLPRRKVLAAVVRLLECTLIRVGNDEYAKANRSFGLTTMRDRHVRVRGGTIQFSFNGKGGRRYSTELNDRRLARIVKRCQEIPGQVLFQYYDDEGDRRTIESGDVNDYLREISGADFTAKDFRTWAGTVLAAAALREAEQATSEREAKQRIVRAIEQVAEQLGNTPAICRKCYVHPAVIDAYSDGSIVETLAARAREQVEAAGQLDSEEAAVLDLLRRGASS